MPTQYVHHVNDANLASIETVAQNHAHAIEVVVDDSRLFWKYGNKCLCVALVALEKASLSIGTFGPNEYVFLTLHFGDANGGGVFMLRSSQADAESFGEIMAALKTLLPCPINDHTAGNR